MRAGLVIVGAILLITGVFLTMSLVWFFIGIPVGFIGFIILIIGLVTSDSSSTVIYQQPNYGSNIDNLDILKRRLAKGEISKKEYNKLKEELEYI